MPSNIIKSVMRNCGMSKEDAEKKWEDAASAAKKKGLKDGDKSFYKYATKVFTHMVGKDCMHKMHWNESNSRADAIMAKHRG